jgi:hypothetical protein
MLSSERIARERALFDYGADADTVLRAKGWAVLFTVMLLDTGIQDHPRHAAIGYIAFRQLQEDHAWLAQIPESPRIVRVNYRWLAAHDDPTTTATLSEAERLERVRALVRVAAKPQTESAQLLDVGCGAGQLSLIAARAAARVTG